MCLNLLQCPMSGLRHEHDAEEKAQGGYCRVDPEHPVVSNQLYQVGVAKITSYKCFISLWKDMDFEGMLPACCIFPSEGWLFQSSGHLEVDIFASLQYFSLGKIKIAVLCI